MRKRHTAAKLIFIFLFFHSFLFAQTDSLKLLLSPYKFIKADKNVISNASALNPFFATLYKLKTEKSEVVSVLHIGDSHIQADYFSGWLRMNLQRYFGNAGRGLIFPYKVAKTNEPYNFKTTSNTDWEAYRFTYPNLPVPTGICGITIRTSSRRAMISLKTFNYPGLNYSFRHIDIYHENDSATFGLGICDTLGNILKKAFSPEHPAKPWLSAIHLDSLVNQINLSNLCEDTLRQGYAQMYGLVLLNDSNGLIYHTVGVNGAMYRNYSNSKYFIPQAKTLHPQLIILSLGTNEAQSLRLTKDQFYSQVDSLVKQLQVNTGASVLLTIPQDSYRRKWHYNPKVKMIAETLIEYAKKNNMAYWDFYTIAGGFKSCYSWRKKGLMRHDGMHLSRLAYEIQGRLFYAAILNAYNRYVSDRHP